MQTELGSRPAPSSQSLAGCKHEPLHHGKRAYHGSARRENEMATFQVLRLQQHGAGDSWGPWGMPGAGCVSMSHRQRQGTWDGACMSKMRRA